MKKFKTSIITILITALASGLVWAIAAHAATTPSLGQAAGYGVLASTYTNTSTTTINGSVGFTTPPAIAPLGVHPNYGSGSPYATAGVDQGSALNNLNSQPCTFTWGSAVDLSSDATHGTIGVYAPGVYCSTGAMSVTTNITLSGSGTYIFRAVGALNTTAGSSVILANGASVCDVFWTPTAATTLGANTTFFGTVIDPSAITVGANSTWTGRALAFSGTVTTDTNTITVPTCTGTVNVVKTVINDGNGTKSVADFPLFVNGASVVSGATTTLAAPGSYAVTETADSDYAQSFSGDCNSTGDVSLSPGAAAVCVVTNDDIGGDASRSVPPLISVVKVPSPLTLPSGAGSVTYTFTLSNLGTVPATNITMADDSCSPAAYVSGDTNANSELDVTETWEYTCTTTVSSTHTNTAVATGAANGITATDLASATVVVGAATVPPLIHVTKVPDQATLTTGGGSVTYTIKVTNPGTAALENVQVADDKCSPVTFVSGDTNSDSKLDAAETWNYTCGANLAATTTNTAAASGSANGLTARDVAIATVIVANTPALPNTALGNKHSILGVVGVQIAVILVLFLSHLVQSRRAITKQ